jgi:hypothetical protein
MSATPIKKVTPFNMQVPPNNALVTPDKVYSTPDNTTHKYPQINPDEPITLKRKIAQTTCAVI